MLLITTSLLLLLAFVFKGIMDKSSEGKFASAFWNKTESWEYKYASPLTKGTDWWYFGLHKTTYKEAFPFSSTLFVPFTDGWHLAQFVFLNSMFLALSINIANGLSAVCVAFVGIRIIYIIGFSIGHK